MESLLPSTGPRAPAQPSLATSRLAPKHSFFTGRLMPEALSLRLFALECDSRMAREL